MMADVSANMTEDVIHNISDEVAETSLLSCSFHVTVMYGTDII
jgi:hypothetical protein